MRPRPLLLAPALALAAVGCSTHHDGRQDHTYVEGACLGPTIDTQPPSVETTRDIPRLRVRPGQTAVLYGHWYRSTCHYGDPTATDEPLPAVTVTVDLPGGQDPAYGPLRPSGDDYGFELEVPVPADSPAGVATVRDGLGHVFHFRVTGR